MVSNDCSGFDDDSKHDYAQRPEYLSWQENVEDDLSWEVWYYLDYYQRNQKSPSSTLTRSFRRSIDVYWGMEGCPNRDVPGWRCGGNKCLYCFERNIFSLGSAIIFSQPRYFFTIGLVPVGWKNTQRYMQALKQHLQTNLARVLPDKPIISWVWAVEDYSRLEGVHIHGYMHQVPGLLTPTREDRSTISLEIDRFSNLPKTRQGLTPRAGEAYVEYAELAPDANATYLMKSRKLSQMVLHPEMAVKAMARYRELNGSKIVHTTNGDHSFFRDAEWNPLTKAKAETLACQRYRVRPDKGSYSAKPAILRIGEDSPESSLEASEAPQRPQKPPRLGRTHPRS